MPDFPLWVHLAALALLLLLSAFFSMTETALMAMDRLRLRHLVREGNAAARRTQALLDQTDRLLSVLLLGNNLANSAITAIVAAMAIYDFASHRWALLAATIFVTFLILVFAEITPKIVGARFPEPIALASSLPLRLLLKAATPVVWFVNLFVRMLLWALRISPRRPGGAPRITSDELRTLVVEGSGFAHLQHRAILLNALDIERMTVDDVMTPRASIEGINLEQEGPALVGQLTTCYHNKLPVYEGDIDRVVGILHVRKLLPALAEVMADPRALRELLVEPYWIPTATPLLRQLQMFQENRQRLGLVVDEYGDLLGLVTVDDIVEEIVGEFTTQAPGGSAGALGWGRDGQLVVDGGAGLRLLNRRLGLALPLGGPRTLNGLVLELLQELPEGPCCLLLPGCRAEILQVGDQAVRSVRLIRVSAMPDPAGSR
jgi:Mg2+/Co2+ transporter CorB